MTHNGNRIPDVFRKEVNYRMRKTMERNIREQGHANIWELCEVTANHIGCIPWTVWAWYEGKCLPTLYHLVQFADCFDVSIDYLLGRTAYRQLVKSGHLKAVA